LKIYSERDAAMSKLVNDNRQIIPVVKFLLPTLTNTERKAALFLLERPKEINDLTLSDFAQSSGSSPTAIIRLCKKIGVDGYARMKLQLALQLVSSSNGGDKIEVSEKNNKKETIAPILKRVFETNIRTLIDTMALYSDEYDRAFQAVLKAKQIAFFAIGDAMHPCEVACFKFRKLGYICHADTDPDLQIIGANNLGKEDVAIFVSHTGKTRQVVYAAKIAKKRGAQTICITKYDKSPLLKYCDIKLFTATSDIVIGQEIAARRVAENAILEALFLGVLEHGLPGTVQKIDEISEWLKENKIK
jgi:DNA-binding MurR/RpiR family transcriptional regulator